MNSTDNSYNRSLIVLVSSVSIFIFGAGLTTMGSVIPDLKEKFQLDEIGVGAIFSILPFGILTGSLLFGPIADRFGYRLMLGVACVLMFCGLKGIASSNELWLLKLAVFCFGAGGGAINGGTSAAVSDISKQKAAALSLLGVFFGLGAMLLLLVIGALQGSSSNEIIISILGYLSLVIAVGIFLSRFPSPKQVARFPVSEAIKLFQHKFLLLIAFFLFCQSSFEGIINNWTTLYLTGHFSFPAEQAIFSLSVLMIGMTLTRLVTATILKNLDQRIIISGSLLLLLAGVILLHQGGTFILAAAGLFLVGSGLAGGFPIMLGFVGKRFAELSGTAFSFVLVIALFGNMLVNYLLGIVTQRYGIGSLMSFCYVEIIAMSILSFFILQDLKKSQN